MDLVYIDGSAYACSLKMPAKLESGVSFPVSIFRDFTTNQEPVQKKSLYRI